MKKIRLAPAIAGLFLALTLDARAQFASSVVSYSQGDVNNNAYYATFNNPTAALGAPSAISTDPYFGASPVDPFDAPYLNSQIVGVGAGGSLTLQFNTPILNSPSNPFGVDFLVFGHAGFTITNGDYSSGGITDGSLYAGGTANMRVSVSADGVHFFTLNPNLTPQVDALFPTDGSGNPVLPVNPALTAADFAGKNLAQIRALYAGSAGGEGFSLNWAVDSSNQSVLLPSVNYVRFDGVSDVAFIDAVAVVPEPSAAALALLGAAVMSWLPRAKRMAS